MRTKVTRMEGLMEEFHRNQRDGWVREKAPDEWRREKDEGALEELKGAACRTRRGLPAFAPETRQLETVDDELAGMERRFGRKRRLEQWAVIGFFASSFLGVGILLVAI